MLLKYRKETNVVFSYIIGCVYLNENISHLLSLLVQAQYQTDLLHERITQLVERKNVCRLRTFKV